MLTSPEVPPPPAWKRLGPEVPPEALPEGAPLPEAAPLDAPGLQLKPMRPLLPLPLPAMLAAMLFMRWPAFLSLLNIVLATLWLRTPLFMSDCRSTGAGTGRQ